MCGIIGYIGSRGVAFDAVFLGLKNLEHRGYDSAGAAFCFSAGEVKSYKVSREELPKFTISDLSSKAVNGRGFCGLGIGHTRWASCGKVNNTNAHPHHSRFGRIWVVHNGNVINFDQLRKEFSFNDFYSETDTELIANLISRELEKGFDLRQAIEAAMRKIEGANAVVVIDKNDPGVLAAANRGGTLLYGRDSSGQFFIASDPAPLDALCLSKVFPMRDGEIILAHEDGQDSFDFSSSADDQVIDCFNVDEDRKFHHLMEKEIFDQPFSFASILKGRIIIDDGITRFGGLESHARDLRSAQCFHFLGCGTAYHACQYAVMLLNRFGIRAEAHISSEFCHGHKVFDHSDVFFIVSQSGETADSVSALREIKIKGNPTFGIINREGSRIWRETGAGIHIRAGVEKSVASTKAFTCQLMAIAMLAVYLARQRKMTIDTARKVITELQSFPAKAAEIVKRADEVADLVQKYLHSNNFYFLGRYFNHVVASEGALKLKEVSYFHAESYPLGELKHGPLALIDKRFVSIVIAMKDSTYLESLGNIREIRAREGKVIVVTDDEMFDRSLCDDLILVPSTLEYLSPIISIIPLQIFAYHFAVCWGLNPDKPRNLAKTVTVG
jgi:glucosamine--fructose-6-phosphate aminotransferase (isomerizing)